MRNLSPVVTTNLIPNYFPKTYEVKEGNVIMGYVEYYRGAYRGITLSEKKLRITLKLRKSAERVAKASKRI